VGAALLLTSPANAQTLDPVASSPEGPSSTIRVPSGFDSLLSDTRLNGHLGVQGTALHIWADGSGDTEATSTGGTQSSDKVAEYVDTTTPLSAVEEPTLDFTNTSGGHVPGYQLVVDFNHDGTADGILVGEPSSYKDDWWLSNGSAQFVKDGAPSHTPGSGSANHGTLDQWRAAFSTADVKAFGFSLGSGVQGDGLINSITFAGTTFTFAKDVILTSKNDCKTGGWATSTVPVYKNQGECVSHFASSR
jgi:hypothetical protein